MVKFYRADGTGRDGPGVLTRFSASSAVVRAYGRSPRRRFEKLTAV